jgi:hypothetical protein
MQVQQSSVSRYGWVELTQLCGTKQDCVGQQPAAPKVAVAQAAEGAPAAVRQQDIMKLP